MGRLLYLRRKGFFGVRGFGEFLYLNHKPIEETCHASEDEISQIGSGRQTDAGAVMDTLFVIGQISALLCLFYGGVICITQGTTANREPRRKKQDPFVATRDRMESD